MTTKDIDFQDALVEALLLARDGDVEDAGYAIKEAAQSVAEVRTYYEVGMLTQDAGFVVTNDDGTEYQVTIIRRR